MSDSINYGHLMQRAMQSLVREVLIGVAENGLPGEHHFTLDFDTTHRGVDMPAYLRKQFPDRMRIILQHWFEDLAVMNDRFTVTLSFSNQPERLVIPFDAIRTFVDPSVEFGLRFDPVSDDDDGPPEPDDLPIDEDDTSDAPAHQAEVVSLDKFRK